MYMYVFCQACLSRCPAEEFFSLYKLILYVHVYNLLEEEQYKIGLFMFFIVLPTISYTSYNFLNSSKFCIKFDWNLLFSLRQRQQLQIWDSSIRKFPWSFGSDEQVKSNSQYKTNLHIHVRIYRYARGVYSWELVDLWKKGWPMRAPTILLIFFLHELARVPWDILHVTSFLCPAKVFRIILIKCIRLFYCKQN